MTKYVLVKGEIVTRIQESILDKHRIEGSIKKGPKVLSNRIRDWDLREI